jgi:hypothetical protein
MLNENEIENKLKEIKNYTNDNNNKKEMDNEKDKGKAKI